MSSIPERIVYWKALADFSKVVREAAKAEAALKSLEKQNKKTSAATNELGNAEDTAAAKTTKSSDAVSSAVGKVTRAKEQAAKASKNNVAASHEEVRAARALNEESARTVKAKANEAAAESSAAKAAVDLKNARAEQERATRKVAQAENELAKAHGRMTKDADEIAAATKKLDAAMEHEARTVERVNSETVAYEKTQKRLAAVKAANAYAEAKQAAQAQRNEERKAKAIEDSARRQEEALTKAHAAALREDASRARMNENEIKRQRRLDTLAQAAARREETARQKRTAALLREDAARQKAADAEAKRQARADAAAEVSVERAIQRNEKLAAELGRIQRARQAADAATRRDPAADPGLPSGTAERLNNVRTAVDRRPASTQTSAQTAAANALTRAEIQLAAARNVENAAALRVNETEQRVAIATANVTSARHAATIATANHTEAERQYGEGSLQALRADEERQRALVNLERAHDTARVSENALARAHQASASAASSSTSAVTRLGASLRRAEREFGVAAGGGNFLSRSLNSLKNGFDKIDKGAGKAFGKLRAFRWPIMIAGAIGAAGALSSLVDGLFALGAALAPAVGAIAAAGPALFALGGAFAAVKSAFSGMGGVFKAYQQAQLKNAVGSNKAAKNEIDNSDAIKAAQQSLADARENVGITARNVADQVASASRQVVEANRAELDAQKALDDARKAARKNIDDLKNAVIDAALAERGAMLDLADAQANLQKVAADPNSTRADRERAQLQVDVAKQSAKQAQVGTADAKIAASTADAGGVEGDSGVVQARRAVSDANYAAAEAQRNYNKTVVDGARENRKAVADVAKAQAALAKSQRTAATATDAASTANDTYQAKLNALSPAARKFALHLISMKKYWTELKNTTSENLFPGLTRGLDRLPQLFPIVNKGMGGIAKTTGNLGDQLSKLLVTDRFKNSFTRLFSASTPLLNNMGSAFMHILDAIRAIATAAIPLAIKLSKGINEWAAGLAKSADAAEKNGKLTKFFERTYTVLHKLGQIAKNVFGTIYNLGRAATGAGDDTLNSIESITAGWKKWTGSVEGQTKLKKFFDDVRSNMKEVDRLLGKLTLGFLKMGDNKSIKPILKGFEDIGSAIGAAFGGDSGVTDAFVSLLHSVADIIRAITENSQGLKVFLSVIGGFAKAAAAVLSFKPAAIALGLFLSTFALFKALRFVGSITGLTSLGKALGSFRREAALTGGVLSTLRNKFNNLPGIRQLRARRAAATGDPVRDAAPGVSPTPLGPNPAPTPGGRQRRRPRPGAPVADPTGSLISGTDTALGRTTPAPRPTPTVVTPTPRPTPTPLPGSGARAPALSSAELAELSIAEDHARLAAMGNDESVSFASYEAERKAVLARTKATRAAAGIPDPRDTVLSRLRGEPYVPPTTPTSRPTPLPGSGARTTPPLGTVVRNSAGGVQLQRGQSINMNTGEVMDEHGRVVPEQGSRRPSPSPNLPGGTRRLRDRLRDDDGFVDPAGFRRQPSARRQRRIERRAARGGGRMGGRGGAMAAGGAAGMLGMMAGDMINDGKGGVRQAVGGAISGAGMGAMMGSAFGPAGMAVGALAGGVMGLLQNSKIGPKIMKWFSNTVWPAIKALPGKMVEWAKDMLGWIEWPFKEAWKGISTAWNAVTKWVSNAFTSFIASIVIFAKMLFNWYIWPYKQAWNIIKIVATAIWTMVKGIWNTMLAGIKMIGTAIGGFLSNLWTGIKVGASSAWNAIKTAIVHPIQAAWTVLKTGWLVIWGWLKNAWGAVSGFAAKVFTGVANSIGGAFGKVKGLVKKVWDGVKAVFATAINFITQDIINKLIDGVNAVLHAFGVKGGIHHIPAIGGGASASGSASGSSGAPSPAGGTGAGRNIALAKGGVLPGYTPGRDPHKFRSNTGLEIHLSGGEGILTPETTRAIGGKRGIDKLNRTFTGRLGGGATGGNRHANGGVLAFKDGGTLDDLLNLTGTLSTAQREQMIQYILSIRSLKQDYTGLSRTTDAGIEQWFSRAYAIDHGGVVKDPLHAIRSVAAWATKKSLQVAELPLRAMLNGVRNKTFRNMGNGAFNKINDAAYNFIAGKRAQSEKASGNYGGAANVGGSGQSAVWQNLIAVGMSPVQAAGVMGNMQAESGFNPYIIQGGGTSMNPAAAGGGGYGLVQWTPGSKLIPYLHGKPPSVSSEVQALAEQLSGKGPSGEGGAGAALRRARTPGEAATIFGLQYERYAGGVQGGRASAAEAIYSHFMSNRGTSGGSLVMADGGVVPAMNFHSGGVVPYFNKASNNAGISAMLTQAGIGFPAGNSAWLTRLTSQYGKRLAGVDTAHDVSHTSTLPRTESLLYPSSATTRGMMNWVDKNDPSTYGALWTKQPYGKSANYLNDAHRNPLLPIQSYVGGTSTWKNFRKNKDAATWARLIAADKAKDKKDGRTGVSYTLAAEKRRHPTVAANIVTQDKQWAKDLSVISAATGQEKYRVAYMRRRLGLSGAGNNSGLWSSDMTMPADHAAAHALGKAHPADWPHPWSGAVTTTETTLAEQDRSNALNDEWRTDLTTLAGWGLTNLVDYLMDKGISDGMVLARDAVKDRATATQLNASIAAGAAAAGTGDDTNNIIRIIGKLSSGTAARPFGLRDISSYLNAPDYTVVNLFDKMASQLAKIPTTLTGKFTEDVTKFRQGLFYANTGAIVPGDKSQNRDTVDARLTPGEGVLNRQAMALLGESDFYKLNAGVPAQFLNAGGIALSPNVTPVGLGSAAGMVANGRGAAAVRQHNPNAAQVVLETNIYNPTGENSVYSMNKNLRRQSAIGTVAKVAGNA